MKVLVEIDELRLVAGLGRPPLAEEGDAQEVDLLDGHLAARVRHGDALERLADLEHLLPVLRRKAADDELAPAAELEEPFLREELERLAHRGLRHAELLGDLAVGDHGPDRIIAAQDPAPDVLVGLLAEPAGGRGAVPFRDRVHPAHLK